MSQLHVAETEKYAHVTYFFNGGEEDPCPGEQRELVPSPRDVATYDERPQMSAPEVAAAFARHWREDEPNFGIVNFANPDMVGHTGVIPAAVEAIEAVDRGLAEVVEAVHAGGGACVVTADHGNADHMLEPDGSPNTAHSLNPVPAGAHGPRPVPARGRDPGRRGAHPARGPGPRAAGGDDRPLADRPLIALRPAATCGPAKWCRWAARADRGCARPGSHGR